MTDTQFPNRLTQLRSRWEADPASRIFLQLAEEYRHLGQMSEALKVLETGLREHPGYLSAQIARGRCLLELGHPAEARDALERVVRQDATQMVANKLLVRAYVETGQTDLALERLELYILLHESDPEIDELRRRIHGAIPPTPQIDSRPSPAPVPEERSPSVPTPPSTAVSLPPEEDLFAFSVPAAPLRRAQGEDDIFDLGLPAAPVFAPPPASPAAGPEPPVRALEDAETPFPELVASSHHLSHLELLQAEGLFLFAESALPAPLAPTTEEPAATVTLGELYLRQGHRGEAEGIFREVLRREPDNPTARQALSRLAEPVPAAAPLEGDLRSRKIYVLTQYLERIRRGSESYVR